MAVIKKDYLTFDELRDRWGITDDDMHYLIGKGDLIPAMFKNDHRLGFGVGWEYSHWEPMVDAAGERSCCVEDDDQGEGSAFFSEIIFLRFPSRSGLSGYSFCTASVHHCSEQEEFVYGEWLLLKKSLVAEGSSRTFISRLTSFDADKFVFSQGTITLCEEKHPELRKLPQTEDQNQTAQPDQGLDKELSGKSVGTVAKIIGGLLMKGYGYDIHTDGKFSFIGEVLKDLESVGASVNENTFREWINRAKEVIEPPKIKPK